MCIYFCFFIFYNYIDEKIICQYDFENIYNNFKFFSAKVRGIFKEMKLKTKMISSLEKVFPDEVKGKALHKATALQNEPFSFQIAFKNIDDDQSVVPAYVRVESDLDIRYISEYLVGYVPVTRATYINTDEFYERKTPGLYPDILLSRKTNAEISDDGFWTSRWFELDQEHLLSASADSYQSLWFTVNENGEPINPGQYEITVSFYRAGNRECLATETLELEIIGAAMPEQELIYTSWFHCDCLADLYDVEVFSDRHFEIIRSFAEQAAKTGMNMILLPAFTPPLDTPVGKYRKTVQLVGVTLDGGNYTFDFSLMEKYINICRECGLKYFEHSHLFTQWGANHAPKIMATVNGEYKRLFGWDTDSKSEEYAAFLKCYLAELKKFLNRVGVGKNILFHISDEPNEEHLAYYDNARKIVGELLTEYKCGDAISHYKYYENGNVKTPVVVTSSDEMDQFVQNCEDFWVYYTGEQLHSGYSNRILSTTSARNRVLGLQMYVSGAKGFLHWGYNYYYGPLSHGLFNPTYNPCGYDQVAGTSFVVYPGITGKAIPSTRMKVLYEGINDYRALQRLESFVGRTATLAFIQECVGEVTFRYCPQNSELFAFRQKLNDEIKKHL